MKAVVCTEILCFSMYNLVSVPIVYLFGSYIKESFFDNMAVEGNNTWHTYVCRFAYLLIIVSHVPYIFFPAKESFLVIIDEIHRRAVSKALEEKIKQTFSKSSQY